MGLLLFANKLGDITEGGNILIKKCWKNYLSLVALQDKLECMLVLVSEKSSYIGLSFNNELITAFFLLRKVYYVKYKFDEIIARFLKRRYNFIMR